MRRKKEEKGHKKKHKHEKREKEKTKGTILSLKLNYFYRVRFEARLMSFRFNHNLLKFDR